MICHWSSKAGPKHSTEDQTCADETYQIRRKTKVSDNEWHRHAEDEYHEAIEQCATDGEHPKPSLDRFQRRTIQKQRQ